MATSETDTQNQQGNTQDDAQGSTPLEKIVDFSKVGRVDVVETNDVSVSYIASMLYIFEKRKGVKGEIELIIEEVYKKHVNPNVMKLDEFKPFVNNPNNSINILLYHAFGEKIREHLVELSRKEFYNDVGGLGVTYDKEFVTWIHRITIDFIMKKLSEVNENKNAVTDMREMTTKTTTNGKKQIIRLVERIIRPRYIKILKENFTREDINILLENDWLVTKGVYDMVAVEKGVNVDVTYPLSNDFRLEGAKKEKPSFLTQTQYQNDEYKKNTIGLKIPLYMRFTAAHERGGIIELIKERWKTKENKRLEEADRMRRRFVHHEKYLEATRKATEEALKRTQMEKEYLQAKFDLERQVRDVNQTFGKLRTLAHDNKNKCLGFRAHSLNLLKVICGYFPEYNQIYDKLNLATTNIDSIVDQIIADVSAPTQMRDTAEFYKKVITETNEMIENERAIMSGGIPIQIKELNYSGFISPIIESVHKVYPDVCIEYTAPDKDIIFKGDERLLKAAFTNLIQNSVEASRPDGRVSICVEQFTVAETMYTGTNIYQTGELKPEHAEKLNRGESFTTKEQGNAVGASASYNIIKDLHNGRIRYEFLDNPNEYNSVHMKEGDTKIEIIIGLS